MMKYTDYYYLKYTRQVLKDELNRAIENNLNLEMEVLDLKHENEKLKEKIDNFNKALEGLRR